jgi:hypothetical protein
MISVFQIFRVLMGIIIFIFVITFFLRIADMYSATQTMGSMMEEVRTFDNVAMQVYSSGNPATFTGFEDFETLVYEAPKIKYDTGQRTLGVPVFFIAESGKISLERQCLDSGWFKWCAVLAFPGTAKVLFTPLENTDESRQLIREVVGNLPGTIEFGFCDGTDARTASKDDFLSFIDGMAGTEYQPCEVSLPDHFRLVTIGAPPIPPSNLTANHMAIDLGAGELSEVGPGSAPEPRPYVDWLDIVAFMTGGSNALDYKKSAFSLELAAATAIMHERSVLVSQRTKELNRQRCLECSTPFPAACGWTDYTGTEHESQIYKDFISSLADLKGVITGVYQLQLDDTTLKYNELKNQGCE